MTERAAAQMRRVAMTCLAAIIVMVVSDLTPASGFVVPKCDPVAPRFSHPVCAERIVDGMGEIVDMAVTDAGDVHLLGEDGIIAAVRPGPDVRIARFERPGALLLDAGSRSLLVGTADGVTRYRLARGELVPEVEGDRIVDTRPTAFSLARLGRLFVASSPTDCEGGCGEIRVYDAFDTVRSGGRLVLPTVGEVRGLVALPAGDVVLGLVDAGGGHAELAPIGDHRGGCVADGCVAVTIPTTDDRAGLAIAPWDLVGGGDATALVAAGSEVWAVAIEDGVLGSVELVTGAPAATFQVAAGPGGEVYLADAAAGTIWRLWEAR